MKIIHCADVHLFSPIRAKFDERRSRTRRMELRQTFERMLEYAVGNDIEAVIIAGDLCDSRSATLQNTRYICDLFARHGGLRIFLLYGNHDGRIAGLPQNVCVIDDDGRVFDGVSISSKATRQGAFNIVVLHGDIHSDIDLTAYKDRGIDYLALGHLHSYASGVLDSSGACYAYSGCLEGRGFDEAGEKGFVVLDTDKKTHDFVPFATRTIFSLELDVTAMGELAIREGIQKLVGGGKQSDIYRVKLVGRADEAIDTRMLEEEFSHLFFFSVTDDTFRFVKRQADLDITLEAEFMRQVMDSDLDQNQKREIIRLGLDALGGRL